MQIFKIRQKLDLSRVCFRGHSHIESFHRLREIDLSGWVGLALWSQNLTHEISIFVKIQFNFKKKNISLKTNLKTLLILPKTKNLYWLHHVTLKTNLSNTHLEKSVETNFFKRFKVIASLPMLTPYLRIFSKKKGFSENVVNPDNLVLTTSTVQVELSKLNLNFDDIRTYFLRVLRDCWQMLLNLNPPPLPNGQYQNG